MTDILVFALAILGSSLSSYLATALQSLPSSVINAMADEGSRIAKGIRKTVDKPEETTLAIGVVDTLFLVAATASLASINFTRDDNMRLGVELLILIITLAVAKTIASVIGAKFAERFLRATSNMIVAMNVLAFPAVALRRLLVGLIHRDSGEDEARDELEALVETAREEGALDAGEYRIMTNIMQLSSIEVGDVMTPRTVVFRISEEMEVSEAVKQPELQMYSRFPVIDGADLDTVSGYVMTKDVLRAALAGRMNTELARLKRPIEYIPENVTLEKALEQFLQKRQHISMVVDEYGGVEGIISMEDIMETVLGAEIVDEADHVVDLRALAKQRRDQRVAAHLNSEV